jgi:hypothetical protein
VLVQRTAVTNPQLYRSQACEHEQEVRKLEAQQRQAIKDENFDLAKMLKLEIAEARKQEGREEGGRNISISLSPSFIPFPSFSFDSFDSFCFHPFPSFCFHPSLLPPSLLSSLPSSLTSFPVPSVFAVFLP